MLKSQLEQEAYAHRLERKPSNYTQCSLHTVRTSWTQSYFGLHFKFRDDTEAVVAVVIRLH